MDPHESSWTGPQRRTGRWIVLAVVVAAGLALVVVRTASGQRDLGLPLSPAGGCGPALRIVAPSSYARVVEQVAGDLSSGPGCVQAFVGVVDGRRAANRIGEFDADVWIADDAAWIGLGDPGVLARPGDSGAGTVLATSPVYMVTDQPTAGRITARGGSWRALTDLLATDSGVRLAVPDPAGSGDGLVGVGALGESVWLPQGMDASALAMTAVFGHTRTVPAGHPARPERPGEVALVPEYALSAGGPPDEHEAVLSGTDHTALMRYTWWPLALATLDPARAAAMDRLLTALSGPAADPALASARLRPATGRALAALPGEHLPATPASPYGTLSTLKVQHVFAVWYPADRRTTLLLAVDVSGSMADPAPGSRTPLIALVQQGCLALGRLLPPDASITLWAFGSKLDPPRDYKVLLATSEVGKLRRNGLSDAVAKLTPQATGTGLYDTILAAYRQATAGWQAGLPNRVMIFTDGRNEDDPGSIDARTLSSRLSAAANPDRPVDLEVVTFGGQVPAVQDAIRPVGGTVDVLPSAANVVSMFVHLAAGGLHA